MPEPRANVGIVVLAAGEGSRMRESGIPKQLLDIAGQPLIARVVENALASVCRPVIVVLGANGNRIRSALSGRDVEIVENQRWNEGMGTSIHAGISILRERGVEAAILTLGDQPLIDAAIFNRLVHTFLTTGKPIVPAEYAGTVGVPVLFAREYFAALMALEADKGCKGLILKNRAHAATFPCPEAEADIDTPEDYARVVALLSS
jgi:molybdenum cofactor cytidylyltransferase